MEDMMRVYTRACEFAVEGDYAGALNGFLWLHDNLVVDVPATEAIRRAYGFLAWAALANKYPPALAKMQDLLALKRAHLDAHPDDAHTAADIRAMEHSLKTVSEPDFP